MPPSAWSPKLKRQECESPAGENSEPLMRRRVYNFAGRLRVT